MRAALARDGAFIHEPSSTRIPPFGPVSPRRQTEDYAPAMREVNKILHARPCTRPGYDCGASARSLWREPRCKNPSSAVMQPAPRKGPLRNNPRKPEFAVRISNVIAPETSHVVG